MVRSTSVACLHRRGGPARLVRTVLATGLLHVLPFAAAPAGAQSPWPERGENLQELPADFSGERIAAVMRGFTGALGVRCSHCHVGEEGAPLSTYDFVSDDNPNKDRARAMLRMLGDINDHLGEMDLQAGVDRVNMWCHTCHAGKPRPQVLSEAVDEAYESGGGAEALARFQSLRAEHYGGPAYDFRAPSVDALGAGFLARGDTATARRFLLLNVEHHPGFGPGWARLGDLAAAEGATGQAAAFYERALELTPGDPDLRERLERVRGG